MIFFFFGSGWQILEKARCPVWILIHTSHFPAAHEPAFDGERAASLCHTGICDRKGQPAHRPEPPQQ